MRSHMGPLLGISCLRSSPLMSSRWLVAGDKPPWTQKILSSTMAANGRKSNTSVQYFQTFRHPYFRRHSSQKPQTCVICRDSWLPRSSVTLPSQRTFKASSRMKVQTEYSPRSTKSPRKRYVMKGGSPPMRKSSSRSQNCPWMSPQIVTGESTRVRLDSLAKTSLARSHRSFTDDYSMNSLLRTRLTIYYAVRRSLFIQNGIIELGGRMSGVRYWENEIVLLRQGRLVQSYLFVMIIKGKLTPMLTKCIRTAISLKYAQLLFLPRFACGQTKLDILASSYHSIGLAKFKRSRAVQKVMGEQLSAIEMLQGKLELLRQQVREEKEEGPALQAYVDAYDSLQQTVASCEINNQWVYNIISWYNLTPLYRTLFQRLVRATQEEMGYLVKALHAMRVHPRPIFQDLVKESVLGQFYRRLDGRIDVSLLRQLEEVLQAPLNFSKRKYFQRYLVNNLESMLKSLNAADAAQVSELMWLFEFSIRAMCDDEVMVTKLEKAILTMRLPLGKEDVQRMLVAYELKGRVSLPIYEQYLKPHLLKRMEDFNDIVRTLKFLICSDAQDSKFLHSILIKLQDMQQTTSLSPESAQTLHFYMHYLRIKGFKAPLHKSVEKWLQKLCHLSGKNHNNISRLVQEKAQRQGQGQKNTLGYSSNCSTTSKSNPSILSPEEFSKLQLNLGHRLRSLNLKTASIYGKARFCCIGMEYCIHQSRGTNSELINIQSENITYVFSSGRVTREVEIRDQILSHYGIKVNHVNLMQFKARGRMCEDECLINRRVASTPY